MPLQLTTVILVLAIVLSAGLAILTVLSLLPATAGRTRPLWPIMISEIGILATISLAFYAGGLILLTVLLFLAFRVGFEAAAVGLARDRRRQAPLNRRQALSAGAVTCLLCYLATLPPLPITIAILAGVGIALLAILFMRRNRSMTACNALLEIALFPVIPAGVFVAAASRPENAGFLLLLFLLVESYDSYALLGGKLFGRRKAFPQLSPNKTIEGLSVGAGALMVTTAAVGTMYFGYSAVDCIAVAVAVGVLSVAGDLAASRLKRAAGVKDYPLLIPYQGGLLDIADAWLMTAAILVTIMASANWLGS